VLRDAVERLKTVKALGMDAGMDFHGRVHKGMARQLIRALIPHEPLFVEEPLLSEHPEGIAQIAQQCPIPIALGERLHSRWDVKPFLPHIDIIQPDISHVGGISEIRRIASMCEAFDIALAPHCPLGPIALAACMQVDAATANFAIQEMSLGIHYNTDGFDLLSYVKDPKDFEVNEGYVLVSSKPGLGFEIDEEAVLKASVDSKAWRSGEFHGPDGFLREW
jgi:galactonate dehydratase